MMVNIQSNLIKLVFLKVYYIYYMRSIKNANSLIYKTIHNKLSRVVSSSPQQWCLFKTALICKKSQLATQTLSVRDKS